MPRPVKPAGSASSLFLPAPSDEDKNSHKDDQTYEHRHCQFRFREAKRENQIVMALHVGIHVVERCASLERANDARMKQSRNPASSACAGLDSVIPVRTVRGHIL